jgi:hypothetical protein
MPMHLTFFLFCFSIITSSLQAQSHNWVVKHRKWTNAHEQKFSEFISIMGETKCGSLQRCLTNKKSNPFYYNKTPKNTRYPSDCADLPFALRAFFAWMEGLPFDYVDYVVPGPKNTSSKDIRYTKYGNKPAGRRTLSYGNTYNGPAEIRRIANYVSTAMYRTHFDYISDFYPVRFSRETIKPGTVLYDASGHAAIVYKVEDDGRVRMMDAHPDQSITYITFGKKFARSRPEHGAGFRNWRPELSYQETYKLKDFSDEMYNRYFQVSGRNVDYYDYIRSSLSKGNLKYNPVNEMNNLIIELCDNTHDRVRSVEAAIKKGIHRKSHPNKLPANIYGTHGEWESYSTPSRDARLKTGFVELKNEIKRFIEGNENRDQRIVYTPTNSRYSRYCRSGNRTCFLAASLLEKYEDLNQSSQCQFSYKRSNGVMKTISFHQLTERLFDLSFDPYHCIELRWGARGSERSSCKDNSNKLAWYDAEQGLRNQIERTYDQYMGYGLTDTRSKLGTRHAPDVDIWGFLIDHLDFEP